MSQRPKPGGLLSPNLRPPRGGGEMIGRKRLLMAAILVSSLAASITAWGQSKPVLTVYTYNSFTSEWGPGPALEKDFEAHCGCDLTWVSLEDGAALLSRLKLEGKNTKA